MTQPDDRDCAFPPHPGDDDPGPAAGEAAVDVLARVEDWYRDSPLERAPLPAAPLVWTAAEVMHKIGVSGWYPAGVTVAAMLAAGWLGERHVREDENRLSGGELATLTGLTGAWVTAATMAGAWPAGGLPLWLTAGWLAAAAGTWQWLRSHRAVQAKYEALAEAQQWIDRKTWWHAEIAPLLGLTGWHLQDRTKTLLGEKLLITTSPHGQTASQVMSRAKQVCEKLAHHEGLDFGTVDLELGRPGQLIISIRRREPWDEPIWHPALAPDSDYARLVPVPNTVTKPQCIGIDPETGVPLLLTLWDQRGGKVIAILAKKDAGKTTILDSVNERVTACDDARLIQINLSKALEAGWWAPLAIANALDLDAAQALRILDFSNDLIRERPRGGRATKVHRPTRGAPLYVVEIDEIDKATEGNLYAQQLLGWIVGTCRSEGMTVIIAGQRGVVRSTGGAKVRPNVDIAVWGKFANASELNHVAGRNVGVPDMGIYGGGNPGVFGICELPFNGSYQRGRTFYWGEYGDAIQDLVADRMRDRRPHVLEPALARLQPKWDKIVAGSGAGTADQYDAAAADLAGQPGQPGEDGFDDVRVTAAGEVVPGGDRLRSKIDHARQVASQPDPEFAALDEDAQARADAQLASMRAEVLAKLPPPPAALHMPLQDLLAAPQGTSSREAAAALGINRGAAYRMLKKLEGDGTAEIRGKDDQARGKGPNQRFYLTARAAAVYQQARAAAGEQPRPAAGAPPGPGWQPRIVRDDDS